MATDPYADLAGDTPTSSSSRLSSSNTSVFGLVMMVLGGLLFLIGGGMIAVSGGEAEAVPLVMVLVGIVLAFFGMKQARST